MFFDREDCLARYVEGLEKIGNGPRVLNVVGVGGIGKTHLLQELRRRTDPARYRTAALDLQVPELRQQETAVDSLRTELGAQGAEFDRYDIAYATLWRRHHREQYPADGGTRFVEQSELLSSILDDGVIGIPVFGTATRLVRLALKGVANKRRKDLIASDETLRILDELPTGELLYETLALFVDDLRLSGSTARPPVLFIDAYEALAPSPLSVGRDGAADQWLRDLLGQLDFGLAVVASREPLAWAAADPDWRGHIATVRVGDLPLSAREDLLAAGGMDDRRLRRTIAEASAGVPYYLQLAVDTAARADRGSAPVVSTAQIVQRFLQHVAPDEIRLLQLLSASRLFDQTIFRFLARKFDLPGGLLVWEGLTSYSFVYPAAAPGWHRLHQLMIQTLQGQLSPAVAREVHRGLADFWTAHADGTDDAAAARTLPRSAALREAAYHGLHAGTASAANVLRTADAAALAGGRQVVDGMGDDLAEYLHVRPDADASFRTAARCLEVEGLLVLGDATAAITAAGDGQAGVADPVSRRLTLATANALRIAGESRAALAMFEDIWRQYSGPGDLPAGFGTADLLMCTGDFSGAFDLVEQVTAVTPADDLVMQGDLHRLVHLAHRFLLQPDEALAALGEAARCYDRAQWVIGQANVLTNRLEMLATSDPEAALRAAPAALEAQHELGALHETGKSLTALAIAETLLDRTAEAAATFDAACAALDRAGYRSGRARAELYRALLHLRQGDAEAARHSLRWAVDELRAVEVYPSLVLLARRWADRQGWDEPGITRAAEAALHLVKPLGSLEGFLDRMDSYLDRLMG
ncbi:hypothetical protein [Streptomyces sp. NPDC001380]|uniref:hypothetical protein n=1 Tax=Streptomyces sp. NPDC001380 TaxID=3364566 RepID=UPI0036904EE1